MSDDIILEDGEAGTYYPVLKRTNIGEKFIGGLIKTENRDLMKKNPVTGVLESVINKRGKVSQQRVVWALVKDSTMPAGTGDNERVPASGEIVRLLFDRGGYHQWITAQDAYGGPLKVGLLIAMNTTHIVRFPPGDGPQEPCGEIRTPEELAAYLIDPTKRNENIGRRGDLAMKECDDLAFIEQCKAAYHQLNATPDIALGEPFPGPASQPVTTGAGAPTDLW
jgi:hypothetical protein